jgi:MFS superfamily sulfate permease-like transporter
LYGARRSEFVLCIAATVGVILVGVLNGILIAVALSLGNFVRRLWRPYDAVLGRVENRRGYHDVRRHPHARIVPGLLLFRFDAPIFFANAEHFARRVQRAITEYGHPVNRVVITAEPITDIDTSGALVLEQLLDDLDAQGIELGFAELKGPIKDRLDDYGLAKRALEFSDPTVGKSVSRYVRDHDVEWTDWAD